MKKILFTCLLLACGIGGAFAATSSSNADTYLIDFPSVIRLSFRPVDGALIARTDIDSSILYLSLPFFALVGANYAALRSSSYREASRVLFAVVLTVCVALAIGINAGAGARSWDGAFMGAMIALMLTSNLREGRIGSIASMVACLLIGAFASELAGLGVAGTVIQYVLFVIAAEIVSFIVALIALDVAHERKNSA